MKASQIALQILGNSKQKIDEILRQINVPIMTQESYYRRSGLEQIMESSPKEVEFGLKNLAKTTDEPAIVQASYSSTGYIDNPDAEEVEFEDAEEIKDRVAADLLESELRIAHSGLHGSPEGQMAVSRIDCQTSLKAKELQTPIQFSSPGIQ